VRIALGKILSDVTGSRPAAIPHGKTGSRLVDPRRFDRVVVAYSGGKDSLACVLHLLDLGVPKSKIELWHHRIDPPDEPFMDWPCTVSFCRAIGRALVLPLYVSYREGGFEREMLRDEDPPGGVSYESPSGDHFLPGGKTPLTTRMKFPQVGAIAAGRWCSAILKIDVASRIFSNDPRYASGRFLFVTGERAEEGGKRKFYPETEPYRGKDATQDREILHWHPVLRWKEDRVWDIAKAHGVVPHPAYRLGWGRLSCMACIFGDPDQWASVREVDPKLFRKIARLEDEFGHTIRHDVGIAGFVQKRTPKHPTGGHSFVPEESVSLVHRALSEGPWSGRVVVRPSDWRLPAGAFKKGGGPT
jgi:3'-phosphoadenosine 5'-phosphosulfate sulfotransferase (PAPS reductase)/FAD synthetase